MHNEQITHIEKTERIKCASFLERRKLSMPWYRYKTNTMKRNLHLVLKPKHF